MSPDASCNVLVYTFIVFFKFTIKRHFRSGQGPSERGWDIKREELNNQPPKLNYARLPGPVPVRNYLGVMSMLMPLTTVNFPAYKYGSRQGA